MLRKTFARIYIKRVPKTSANPSISLTGLQNSDPNSIINLQKIIKPLIRIDSGKSSVPGFPKMRCTQCFCLVCWRRLVDLGSHVGAHWILKGSPNRYVSHKFNTKSWKRVSSKASWKNMLFGLSFDAKMEWFEKQTQVFRIIPVAKHELSGSHEI